MTRRPWSRLRSPRKALLAAAAVTATSAAALVVPSLSAHGAVNAPASTSVPSPIAWAPCSDEELTGLQCARLTVPLDYRRRDGATVSLALTRRPASDPSRRIGSLVVNPGGPGGRGTTFAADAAALLDPSVSERFDIIGFDPRGVGDSSPALQCFSSNQEFSDVFGPLGDTPVPRSAAEIKATLAALRTFTDACGRNGGPILQHIGTADVVRDLDRLRAALGEQKLTFAGFSYGTAIAATYAAVFPHHVRALVLDGAPDVAARATNPFGDLRADAAGLETALDGFLDACADARQDCAFATDGAPAAKFARLRSRLQDGPLDLSSGPVTLQDVTGIMYNVLASPAAFRYAAQVLQTLYEQAFETGARRSLSAARLAEMSAAPDADSEPYEGNGIDVLFAVNCIDGQWPRDTDRYVRLADALDKRFPTFGRYAAISAAPCATWPVRDPDRFQGPWLARTERPLLVVGVTNDPWTSYDSTKATARDLGNARLLTLDGFGHTSRDTSSCIRSNVARYLIDLISPAPGTVCQPDTPPFAAPATDPTPTNDGLRLK